MPGDRSGERARKFGWSLLNFFGRYFFGFVDGWWVASPIQPGGSLAGKDSSEASSTGSSAGSRFFGFASGSGVAGF